MPVVDDAARLVLAVAAPVLLAPLAGCLLLDGVSGPRGRRHGRALSLASGLAAVAVVAAVVVALLHAGVAWASAAAVLAVVASWVGGLFLAVLAHPVVCSARHRRRAPDVVVVLGTKLGPGGRVPTLLAHRLDRATAIWRAACERGRTIPLVVTGGAVAGSPTSEAGAMARYLTSHAVPADCVLVEDRATTTDENLLLAAELIAARVPAATSGGRAAPLEVAVVTNTFHTFRTARTATRLHVPARVHGAPTPWHVLPAASLRELGVLLGGRRPAHVAGCGLLAAAAVLAVVLGH